MRTLFLQNEGAARRAEAMSGWWLGAFSIFYFTATYFIATRRVLWHDELYSLSLSALPHWSDIWAALLGGGDTNPPLFYWITRASLTLFDVGELSVRLPAIVGFWIMCVCLYRFVAVATRPVYGLVAAMLPVFTGAFYYATEARPYGLLLGFASLALVCWQSAVRERYRGVALVLVSVSLGAAVSTHYYAVLVFAALAFGEIARSIHLRKIDAAVWLAFGAGALPVLPYLPLLRSGFEYGGANWSPARWSAMFDFYNRQLAPAGIVLLLLLGLAVLYTTLTGGDGEPVGADEIAPPWPEIAAAVGFAMLPLVAVALGKFVTGGFTDRYAITAIIGVSILIAFGAAKILRGQVAPCLAFVAALGIWFLIVGNQRVEAAMFVRDAERAAIGRLESMTAAEGLPIVAADAHTIVELAHYAPSAVKGRMVYLHDAEIARRRIGTDSTELAIADYAGPQMGLDVQPYSSYVSSHRDFFVYGKLENLCWVVPELLAEGWHVEMLGQLYDKHLLRIRRA